MSTLRRASALLALALLLALHAATPAHAASIQVQRNTSSFDFPTEMVFELSASSDSPISEVVLLYSIGLDQSSFVEVRPDFDPGTEVDVTYVRDTQLYFLPTGVEITYKWVLTAEDGTTLETEPQSFRYQDERFDWQELSERGVTVRWYDGGQAFGQELLDASLRTLDRFERDLGSGITDPVLLTIYSDTGDMRAALPPNSADWIGGQARPDLGLIIGAIAPGDSDEVGRLVPHELSHLILHQITLNPYGGPPPWFDEGLAVVNEESSTMGFDERVEQAAEDGQLIPLEALASGFPADPDQALLSYAQSASIVRFIQQEFGNEQFTALVEQFSQGVTPEQATQAALGLTIDEIDARWRETLPELGDAPPLPTPAVHAPEGRFDITTPRSPNSQPGNNPELPTGDSDEPWWEREVEGVPVAVLVGGVGLGLLLIAAALVIFVRGRQA